VDKVPKLGQGARSGFLKPELCGVGLPQATGRARPPSITLEVYLEDNLKLLSGVRDLQDRTNLFVTNTCFLIGSSAIPPLQTSAGSHPFTPLYHQFRAHLDLVKSKYTRSCR
jgi:hypothetical protein